MALGKFLVKRPEIESLAENWTGPEFDQRRFSRRSILSNTIPNMTNHTTTASEIDIDEQLPSPIAPKTYQKQLPLRAEGNSRGCTVRIWLLGLPGSRLCCGGVAGRW